HDWSVEYTWSTDGKSCTATHVCGRDSTHNESETVTTSGTETVAPTCTEKGTTTYTATFDADWAQTQTLDVQDIDALGHTYGDPEFTWDEEAYTATAAFNCTVDGCDGSYTTEADVASTTTNATCTEDGKTVYTAVVTFNETEYTDTYEVVIPATGHTTEIRNAKDATCTEDGYTGDEICTVCGETITVGNVIPAIGHSFDSNGVCTTCGAKTGTESNSSSVTVSSGDTIFAEVLSSGLVTSVEVTVSNDNSGSVIISEVVEGTAEPHLVGHIAVDALNFTLYNSSQEDDLISNTSSFNITTTKENKTVIEKVSVLFYGDVDYSGQGTSAVTMKFTGSDLSESTIYVLHYTGTYPEWETVTYTVTTSGTTTTIEFETDSFSPYVVLSVANVSSSGSNSTILDLLLRISANYSSVNDAIARASALDPNDYENFSAVTEAINAVNWNLKAINQLTVNAYADAINTAIDNLVETTANIAEETVEIIDPIEDTNTDTEDDNEEEPSEASEPETNPTTGIAFSILPMVIAALAAVSAKRR
ncbi:MAG: hypothetical protein LIO72_04725, partial [Ruminococcus sp.]|nr:hypothetical protein [Ruminococcus sp.]